MDEKAAKRLLNFTLDAVIGSAIEIVAAKALKKAIPSLEDHKLITHLMAGGLSSVLTGMVDDEKELFVDDLVGKIKARKIKQITSDDQTESL